VKIVRLRGLGCQIGCKVGRGSVAADQGETVLGLKSLRVVSIAALAIVASSAIAATSASASKLTLSEEGVALGFEHGLEGHGRSFYVETPSGEIECGPYDGDEFDAHVMTNAKATDELNAYNFVLNTGESCESFHGRAFPNLYTTGALKLRANGKATLAGVVLAISFERNNDYCSYQTKTLRGTNTATPILGPLRLEFSQTLRLRRSGSSKLCPKTATMHLEFSSLYGEGGATPEEPIEEQT
jgi:hypothetical protein